MKLLQTSTTASLLALASISTTAYAAGKKVPPKAKAHTVEGFAWPNPFESVALKDYSATCEASASLPATEFQLHDLYEEAPLGLLPWADALKEFFSGHEYPGGWEGQDPHGYDRLVLKMEWKDVPAKARQWIEKNGGALFGIYKKPDGEGKKVSKRATPSADGKLEDHVVIFAPGALYGILPLFVANGSACEGMLSQASLWPPGTQLIIL